ncbi:MAG TPA: type VI secretion system lipoprotein TssJ [Syntrophales bacterium]|nr:type VI secretion system lipoprotein TssJ [Syntrophales bacterium]HON23699.1 type VI secretion system lipoprotein TssJ [Syntrophales bacterium]HOU77276.1 type VI secretion system lipoprotein TssJ [Syntrophales bacterium]HPC32706.1 type VI secretion system lipoprotein TssJ [Syntrophales bacterium]HQG34233.1 type VI secretion system lipoprotein TssJ [Syntrophales bacterium]
MIYRTLLLIVVLITICSCSSKPSGQGTAAPPPGETPMASTAPGPSPLTEGAVPNRVFGPKAVRINYKAAANLNFYENRAHTILLVVYQLSGLNAFNQQIKTAEGLSRLLQAERFDNSVTGVDQTFIEPGEEKALVLDRYENTQAVAVVAGYYDLQPGQVTRIFDVPARTEKRGIYGFRSTVSWIEPVSIRLFLGPNSIHEVMVR